MKATIEEIDKMIGLLKHQRTALPEISFFGENNWKAIDSQLEILVLARSGHFPNQDDLDELDEYQYDVACWILNTSSSNMMTDLTEEFE